MNRAHLQSLRDAIDIVLGWPDEVRSAVAGWLRETPLRETLNESPRGNGADRDASLPVRETPVRGSAQARRRLHVPLGKVTPEMARASEAELLEVMRDNPNAGASELARLTNAGSSTVIERRKRLRERGLVERDEATGLWRVVGEPEGAPPARPTRPPETADSRQATASPTPI